MGTHGRNSITLEDGTHYCHEQSMDGHDACDDIIDMFLYKLRNPEYPTMNNDTNECNHYWNFAHTDYKNKMFCAGCDDPEHLLSIPLNNWIRDWGYDPDNSEDMDAFQNQIVPYNKVLLENKKKLISEGWTFKFNCFICPKECECDNSREATVKDFKNDTIKFKMYNLIGRNVTHEGDNYLLLFQGNYSNFVVYDDTIKDIHLYLGPTPEGLENILNQPELVIVNFLNKYLKDKNGN